MNARVLTSIGAALVLSVWPARAHADERVARCADAAEQGQELRGSQKLVEARQRFVACAQRDCPAAVRESCTEWLAEVDRRMPSLVVSAKDERGHDVREVVVTLDGVRLPESATSTAVAADPGPHTLRCEAPGREPLSEELVLREGEPLRVVAMTFRTNALAQPVIGPERAERSERPERPFPVLPVALGATSVVALGIFAVAGVSGANDYRSLERECSPRCSSDRIDDVRTRFLVADVALAVGIVTGLSALALWVFDRPSAPEARAGR